MILTGRRSVACERSPVAAPDDPSRWTEGESERDRFIARLIGQLAATIAELSTQRPDPSDGDGWLSFDAALSDLYGALITLERLDRHG